MKILEKGYSKIVSDLVAATLPHLQTLDMNNIPDESIIGMAQVDMGEGKMIILKLSVTAINLASSQVQYDQNQDCSRR